MEQTWDQGPRNMAECEHYFQFILESITIKIEPPSQFYYNIS
jgi:hypothetical protein